MRAQGTSTPFPHCGKHFCHIMCHHIVNLKSHSVRCQQHLHTAEGNAVTWLQLLLWVINYPSISIIETTASSFVSSWVHLKPYVFHESWQWCGESKAERRMRGGGDGGVRCCHKMVRKDFTAKVTLDQKLRQESELCGYVGDAPGHATDTQRPRRKSVLIILTWQQVGWHGPSLVGEGDVSRRQGPEWEGGSVTWLSKGLLFWGRGRTMLYVLSRAPVGADVFLEHHSGCHIMTCNCFYYEMLTWAHSALISSLSLCFYYISAHQVVDSPRTSQWHCPVFILWIPKKFTYSN